MFIKWKKLIFYEVFKNHRKLKEYWQQIPTVACWNTIVVTMHLLVDWKMEMFLAFLLSSLPRVKKYTHLPCHCHFTVLIFKSTAKDFCIMTNDFITLTND